MTDTITYKTLKNRIDTPLFRPILRELCQMYDEPITQDLYDSDRVKYTGLCHIIDQFLSHSMSEEFYTELEVSPSFLLDFDSLVLDYHGAQTDLLFNYEADDESDPGCLGPETISLQRAHTYTAFALHQVLADMYKEQF